MNAVGSEQAIVRTWKRSEGIRRITQERTGMTGSGARQCDVLLMQRNDIRESLHVAAQQVFRFMASNVVRRRGHEDRRRSAIARETRDLLQIRTVAIRRNPVRSVVSTLRPRHPCFQG